MLLDVLFVVGGLGLLVLAGDSLVRGAVTLSLRLGVPALVVGLTVVAFGTSAPELLVSVQAALKGAPEIALGNVVGSNIANVLVVMGLPALFAAVQVGHAVRRDYAIMMAGSVLFVGLALGGTIGRLHGVILLAAMALALAELWQRTLKTRPSLASTEVPEIAPPLWKTLGFLAFGLVGLPIGADLLVDGAVGIARAVGVSELAIGLTIVAVGTSLPELFTTLIAALRREAGVAMGNVLGSNLFNLLFIMGVTGLVAPIPVPAEALSRDVWVMLASSALLLYWVVTGKALGRWGGVGFLVLYAGYLATLS